jgi:hypothetical protein
MHVCRSMLNPLDSLSFSDECVSLYVKPLESLSFSDACVSLYVKPFETLIFSDEYVSLYVKPFGIFTIFWCMCVALCYTLWHL